MKPKWVQLGLDHQQKQKELNGETASAKNNHKSSLIAAATRRMSNPLVYLACKAAITSVNFFGPPRALDQNLDRDLGARVLNLLLK